MLAWLSIQGLALVDLIELSFDPSLNVLTGETGAGKSIILGSIALLLGERADPDWLRAGEAKGFVEGVFDLKARDDLLEALRESGIEAEEGQVILRRELSGDGKSRALVNGRTVLLSELRRLGDLLVDLHGQHEHQLLLHPERQTEFFDAWAGLADERSALAREREAIAGERRALREDRAAWERDRTDEEQVREDLAELTAAALLPGEEESLKEERERLRHRERMLESLRAARQSLAAEEGGAEGPVRRAARTLRTLAGTTSEAEALAEQAERLFDSLREMAGALEDAESKALEEPLPLERLDATELALSARVQELGARIDRLVEARRSSGDRFEREVGGKLKKLGFQKASLSVQGSEPGEGRDRAAVDPPAIPGLEFQFRPNPGEPARALKRIASGGELSRVMLAVKSLMAERDRVSVLVFDEVDQGIGGAVGEEVGRMLRAIGQLRQVLCITHLPLIAAHGARHFEVVKSTSRGRTTTGVRLLSGKEREEEISRLLAGARVTDTTRRQARELLRAVHAA